MSGVVAAAMVAVVASAPAVPATMTEAEAVAAALGHLGTAELAAAAGAAARAGAEAHTPFGPTSLGWSREQTFGSGRGDEDAFVVGQSFDLSGRAGLRAEADVLRGKAAERGASEVAIDLAAEVRLRFHAVRAARARVAILEIWRSRLAVAEELVEARVAAGDEARFALVHTHHELARAEMAAATAAAARDAAGAELAAWLGLPAHAPLPELLSRETPRVEPDALAAFVARLDGHPAAQASAQREQAAERVRASGERAWVPGLDVELGYKTAGSPSGRSHGYVAGLTVSVLLDGDGAGESERGAAEAARVRAQRRSWRVRQEARVRRAFAETRRLAAVAARSAEHLAHGHEALLKAAILAYQGGELDLDGLLEAQADARDDRLAVIDLTERAWRARVELDRVSGSVE